MDSDSDSDLDSDSKFDVPPVPPRKKSIKVRTEYRQEKITNYLLWYYKITKEDTTRQIAQLSFPAPRKKVIKATARTILKRKKEKITYYLLWQYKIKHDKRTPKNIFYYPKRQTSILEYMDLPYNIIWYKGLDIFEQKDYLTNEQEEVAAVKNLEGSDYETWDVTDDEYFFYYQEYFDECLYGHDLDCFFSEYGDPGRCSYYWEMEDEYGDETNFYNQLEAIVDDFIKIQPQPYERFELGIFCLHRIRDCNRFFEKTFHKEYAKILKEFAQFKCSQIKDELLAAVYHPDRIMRLLARGYLHAEIVECYG